MQRGSNNDKQETERVSCDECGVVQDAKINRPCESTDRLGFERRIKPAKRVVDDCAVCGNSLSKEGFFL